MGLAEELALIYRNAIRKETPKQKNKHKIIESQIRSIISKLIKKAEQGEGVIRLVPETVLPETVDYFIKCGFIVWKNNKVVVIKIPLENND